MRFGESLDCSPNLWIFLLTNIHDYSDIRNRFISDFNSIVVTGPQRSGTTFTAKAIAHDCGFKFINEFTRRTGVDFQNLQRSILSEKRIVIQSPILSPALHLLKIPYDCAIVFMHRNIEDILKSELRIKWSGDKDEKLSIRHWINNSNFSIELDYSQPVSALKYKLWWEVQYQDLLSRHPFQIFNLNYESMSCHPMWIDASKRSNFLAKQTE